MAVVTTSQPITTKRLRIQWHIVWTALIAVFWVAIAVGVVGDYFFKWPYAGFRENGNLWSWIQLLTAPVFVSALPFVFKGQRTETDNKATEQQSQPDGETGEQQKQTNLQVEENRQQEAILATYQDYMSELLLNKNLSGSQPGSDVREVAKARTLAALRRVGKNHQSDLLQFLCQAGLLYTGKAIIDLHEADLRGADLSGARLKGSELSGVDLSNASLSGTDLSGANLSGANLTGADLSNAKLSGANLAGAICTREQLSKAQA